MPDDGGGWTMQMLDSQNERLCENGLNDYCGVNVGISAHYFVQLLATRCTNQYCLALVGKFAETLKSMGSAAGVTYAWDNYGNPDVRTHL